MKNPASRSKSIPAAGTAAETTEPAQGRKRGRPRLEVIPPPPNGSDGSQSLSPDVAPFAEGIPRLALRVEEAAKAIGCSRSKAYELIAAGAIPSIRLAGMVRVPFDGLRDRVIALTQKREA